MVSRTSRCHKVRQYRNTGLNVLRYVDVDGWALVRSPVTRKPVIWGIIQVVANIGVGYQQYYSITFFPCDRNGLFG